MTDKDDTIAVRNAVFVTGDGKSLESVLSGTTMAQAKLAVETAETPEQARAILEHFYGAAIEALPFYWAERGRGGRDHS